MIYPEFRALFDWAADEMRRINARARPCKPAPLRAIKPVDGPRHYEPLDACICNAVRMPPCSYCLDGKGAPDAH